MMEKRSIFVVLTILLSVTVFDAGANWLDNLVDKSKQIADKALNKPTQPTSLLPLTEQELAPFPKHYQFKRVREGVHQSPLFYFETGKRGKPPLLLVHGLGNTGSQDWLRTIPALEKDYYVYALDLPGFGLSTAQYFEYSPKQYSRVLDWFVQHKMVGKPIVVGHSMGGAVSLYFAAHYPQHVEKLVLVDAAGIVNRTTFVKHLSKLPVDRLPGSQTLQRWGARAKSWTDGQVEWTGTWYDPTELMKQDGWLRKKAVGANSNMNAALGLIQTDFSELNFAKVVDTQLIWGDIDPVAPPRTGVVLAHKLGNAELHLMHKVGHVPMQSHPEHFNNLLLKVLAEPPGDNNYAPGMDAHGEGSCTNDDKHEFSGHYRRLVLNNCKLVNIKDASIDTLEANNSIVHIVDSHIGNGEPIQIKGSVVTATVSRFNGTLTLNDARLDLAGVSLTGKRDPIDVQGKAESMVLFSLSEIDSSAYRGRVHGQFELGRGVWSPAVVESKRSHP